MGETSSNDVVTQSLQASFADTSSNAVCTDLIQVLSLKAKSNDHYQIEPACRAVGQSSQPNRGFRVGARRCGRAAHRLARVTQPRKATKIATKTDATSSRNHPTSTLVLSRATEGAPETSQERLAVPSGRPGRGPGAPRARPGASRDANRVAQGRLGARRSNQLQCPSCLRNGKFRVLSARLARKATALRFVVAFCRVLAFSQSVRTL